MENGDCNFSSTTKHDSKKELKYSDYLKLEQLLSSQTLRSVECNQPSHHEHLFIITHQVYELWFKQIIFELDSICDIFKTKIESKLMNEIAKRLTRVILIMKLLIEQLSILETMTSLDFLEFRHLLCSASGFQSLQFRLIENKLGLTKECRVPYQNQYVNHLTSNPNGYHKLQKSETDPSLLHLVQRWLEEYPWRKVEEQRFIDLFKKNITNYFNEQSLSNMPASSANREQLFNSLFDTELHKKLVERKERRLSQKALLGAIILCVYQKEPHFSAAFQIINLFVDIDLYLAKWRNSHMFMVQKMIGSQNTGTGGSSGCSYLRSTLSERYNVFIDLANLPVFLIPQQFVPAFTAVKKKSFSECEACSNGLTINKK